MRYTGGDLIAEHPALRAWDTRYRGDQSRVVIPDVGECGSRNALRLSVSTLNKSIWRTKIKRDDLASPSPRTAACGAKGNSEIKSSFPPPA